MIHTYTVLDAPNTYHQRLVRWAIANALLPSQYQRADVSHQERLDYLCRLRGQMLLNLRAAGWAPSEKRVLAFQLCSPCGLYIGRTRAHSCCMPRLCPWCYGRRIIINLFSQLEESLFVVPKAEKPRLRLPRIALARFTYLVSGDDRLTWDAALAALIREAATLRRQWFTDGGNHGGATLANFEAAPRPEEASFPLLRLTGVLLVPDTWLPPRDGRSAWALEPPTREGLARTVAQICPFPGSWYYRPAAEVLRYLEATRNTKLLTTVGCLRPSRRPEAGEEEDDG